MKPVLLLTILFAGFDQTLEPQLGENITLPCQVPSNANIKAVNWTKPDLGSQNVFFYRDGQPDTDNQHQSFENRVQLDNEPKGGNLSLVLKNVSSSDYGRYECSFKESKGEGIITSQPICIVILKEPGRPMLVICVVVVVVVVGGGVFGYVKMRKRCTEKNSDLTVSYTPEAWTTKQDLALTS
ncbi:uncharacterized protein LOC144514049 isoform X2 [Sander vitreus]